MGWEDTIGSGRLGRRSTQSKEVVTDTETDPSITIHRQGILYFPGLHIKLCSSASSCLLHTSPLPASFLSATFLCIVFLLISFCLSRSLKRVLWSALINKCFCQVLYNGAWLVTQQRLNLQLVYCSELKKGL